MEKLIKQTTAKLNSNVLKLNLKREAANKCTLNQLLTETT